MYPSKPGANLLIVGDVHNHWRAADRDFLERSGCDLAIFVGDLGDEDVAMAEAIAAVNVPKVIILGNHDAWQSFSLKRPTNKLRAVIDRLGDAHIGYGLRECYAAGCSVIGARPFSWGGKSLRSPELYRELYAVSSPEQSAERIVELARRAEHRDLLVIAHNGPKGLSPESSDIWGKDFGKPGGDWGDDDLRLALDEIERLGLRVRAVIAGHMHDHLHHPRGEQRTRFVRRNGTLFINAAVVPRVRNRGDGHEVGYFLRLHVAAGDVTDVRELWVDGKGNLHNSALPEVRELPRVS